MEKFKIGDKVKHKENNWEGKIVSLTDPKEPPGTIIDEPDETSYNWIDVEFNNDQLWISQGQEDYEQIK